MKRIFLFCSAIVFIFILSSCGKNNCTVILDSKYNSVTINAEKGSKIDEPQLDPVDCYELEGWFNGDLKWDFSKDIVKSDLTLEAKWIQVSHSQGLEYELKDGTYSVKGKGSFSSNELVIPRRINGLNVTRIDSEAFYDCDFLTKITIPDTINDIASSAFLSCNNVETIVVDYGNETYMTCQSGGKYLLDEKSGVVLLVTKDRIIPDSENAKHLSDSLFADLTFDKLIIPSNIKTIGYGCFQNCSISSLTFNDGIESISMNAFSGCSLPEKISLPGSMTTVDEFAFPPCVKEITFNGTKDRWNEVHPFDDMSNTVIHCTDGDIG